MQLMGLTSDIHSTESFGKVTGGFLLFAFFVLWPNDAARGIGFTVDRLFQRFLPSEVHFLFDYQVKRTTFTLASHGAYLVVYCAYVAWAKQGWISSHLNDDADLVSLSSLLFMAWLVAAIAGTSMMALAFYWSFNTWSNHPACRFLKTTYSAEWHRVARAINVEAANMEKFEARTALGKLIITDSWIVQCHLYTLDLALIPDTDLSIVATHEISQPRTSEVKQLLTVTVTSVQPGTKAFIIRVDGAYYQELRDRLPGVLRQVQNLHIRVSLSDRFLAQLRRVVGDNPAYVPTARLDDEHCMGCMAKAPDVKITNNSIDPASGQCFCRPMWCLECLGKWFVNAQNEHTPDRWLAGQAQCPTCRAQFSARDISFLAEPS